MKFRWYVAKYVPDLRRGEPINIGVILFSDGHASSQFLGERTGGSINGRRLKNRVRSVDNYRAWLSYWRDALTTQAPEKALLAPRSQDSSYFIEQGGEALYTERTSADMLQYLFGLLVVSPAPGRMTLAEAIFKRLKVDVENDVIIPIQLPDRPQDQVFFDYRYTNSDTTLMRSLRLGTGKAWDKVNAALFSFARAREVQAGKLVALCQYESYSSDVGSQMDLVGESANIVELNDVSVAERRLADLFHVQRPEA